ncbi:MAG TPA: hypothetical protein VG889_17160 [Rhizomicrobium sp.]|nr:hypothetical protein [Rhizomicrobium sp.]
MADAKKAEGKGKGGNNERRRLGYLKMRGAELRKELQANKLETEELRRKLGMGPKKKGGGAAAGGDEDDE